MRLFAFLDESGEFVFNPTSSRFLVFTAVVTVNPLLFSHEFAALKYELLKNGHCLERFHASEDKQFVRDSIFKLLSESTEYTVHAVVVRKNRVNPVLHKYGVYSIAYRTLLKYLVGGGKATELHIIVDTAPCTKQEANLEQNLRVRATEVLASRNIPHTIVHHSSSAHALLQAADYCAWAIYKKWHAADERSYDLIRNRIINEFDICACGDQDYY